jgi:putative peptidoglycan lipid II flippase
MVNQAKRLLSRANRGQTVAGAAVVISGAYLLSRLLGLLRDRLLATHFGVGPELSAYYAAFRLPDILSALLVSGAFAVAFIPVLTEHLKKGERKVAWEVTSSLLTLLVLGTSIGGLLIFLFADPLTTLITPGFDRETHDLTVQLTRIMAVTPVLFGISSVLGSVQQSFNRFFFFALAGVLYNIGIIVGILIFADDFGAYGAAWGVLFGVVLQALIQWFGLQGLGFKYRPHISLKLAGVRQTIRLLVPRTLNQSIDQVHYTVETIIASTVSLAAIGQFSLANNLKNVPLVLIGGSIATAVFPRLAAKAAGGTRSELVSAYVRTARLILFLAIPSALFVVVARGYIVRLLLGDGNAEIANTLGWFAGTIVFISLFMLVSRVYYAMQDTKTVLYLSLISIPINVAVSIVLAEYYGVVGLAMAASIVAALQTLGLMLLLRRRYGNFGGKAIFKGLVPMTVAGAIMASSVYLTIHLVVPLYAGDVGFAVLAPKFLLISIVGAATYLIPCWLLKLAEAKTVFVRLRDIMMRSFNLT